MNKYTPDQIMLAAELGEVSLIDARHIVSLLDKAVQLERERADRGCTCLPFEEGKKWFLNGCKVHA